MGKKNKTQRIVGSPEEARLSLEAERLKNRGGGFREKPDASFEAVYGSTQPGSFNITEDLQAISDVSGKVTEEQMNAIINQNNLSKGYKSPMEEEVFIGTTFMEPPPLEAVINMGPEPKEEEEPIAPPKILTIEEKAYELSKFMQMFFKERGLSAEIPSPELILQWKRMHGDVHMLPINDRLFLFRYLKRQEYIQMMADDKWDKMKEHQRDDILCERCLLYPRLDQIQKAGLPANTLSMIAAQIKIQSLFLDEMYVSTLVMKI